MKLTNLKLQLASGAKATFGVGDREFYVTEKIDGIRVVAVKQDDGSFKLFTRTGNELTGVIDVEYALAFDVSTTLEVLDGELVADNVNGDSVEVYRETQSRVKQKGYKLGLKLHIFDGALKSDDFFNQQSNTPYTQRRAQLDKLAKSIVKSNTKFLEVAPVLYHGNDQQKAYDVFNKVVSRGGEGVIINLAHAEYMFNRTDSVGKIKQTYSSDGYVVAIHEGSGSNAGRLGSIEVTYKGDIVPIGVGFTDEQRQYFWEHPDDIVGHIVEYEYTQSVAQKVRFGRFIAVRDDKDDVHYE